jgi:hypothetical protein
VVMKVILLLECDSCRALLGASADGLRLDGQSWVTTAECLLDTARENGWHLHRSYTCLDCHLNGEMNYLSSPGG